jgi:SAM-dependent methyltransferase
LTELLARRGFRVTAVDGSGEFVEHVRRRMAAAGLAARVDVLQADVERLPAQAESFDAAVCGDVLEHLEDDDAAVGAIASALKPGGVLALTVPAGANRLDWLDEWAGHYRRYEAASLRALLTRNGLSVERLQRWGFPVMELYERLVQRPGLARSGAPGASNGALARLARSAPSTALFGTLFRCDRLFEGRCQRGTAFLAVARKP